MNRTIATLVWLCSGILLVQVEPSQAFEISWGGQASAWAASSHTEDVWENQMGFRYLPDLNMTLPINQESFLDLGISLNAFATTGDMDEASDMDFYRLAMRYATAQTETIVGLQKINFGPAQLLRPLRWFDRVDPTDPQQFTDGVYGVRFKGTATNNANLWLWGLIGNDAPKGYELFGSVADTPEIGGRVQIPIPAGQAAITVHRRRSQGFPPLIDPFTEERFGLDFRWDVEIGLWIESVVQHQPVSFAPYDWAKMSTLGLDYTFALGNGLYVLAEHMVVTFSGDPFAWDDNTHVSAFSLSYPIGLLDGVRAIGFYLWDEHQYSQYISWQRTYDTWSITFGLFHYPKLATTPMGMAQYSRQAGDGAQLTLIYHH